MLAHKILDEIEQELKQAEQSRLDGMEGRARVCARRAASMALQAYFLERGENIESLNSYGLLLLARDHSGVELDIRRSAHYLVLRVDENFELPLEIDLIQEARRLIQQVIVSLS